MKKLLLVLGIMATAFPAVAQEQKHFNLSVTGDDLQIIGKALEDKPFKDVAPLIQKLNMQIQAQSRPAPVKPPEVKEGEKKE